MAHYDINARRLFCPMPVIRVQDQAAKSEAGDTIEIVCTDFGAEFDVPAWCRVHGDSMLEIIKTDDDIRLRILLGSTKSES
jgi:tRNA 2-thiouridine synthesizing protein A